ncbi:MAG: AI-2E family transporter [Solobacterium sp.]|nr:AI-2E family transporter [Solobacterium sp.]
MGPFDQKKFLINVAMATAVICFVILLFFRTSFFVGVFSKLISIIAPFIYGAVIAYLLHPVSTLIEKLLSKLIHGNKGMVRMLSVILAVILMFVIIGLLLVAVIPELITSISELVRQLPHAVDQFEKWMDSLQFPASEETVDSIQSTLDAITKYVQNYLQTSILPQLKNVMTSMTSGFAGFIGVLKNFILGTIISIYLLGSWEKFSFQIKMITYALLPRNIADWIKKEVRLTDEKFSGFIYGKLIDSFIIGVLCFIFVSLTKMPYAMLISIIVGVTNIIPFFGPYLGAIPSAILILTVSPAKCIIFIIFVIILQQVDGNVIGPHILGDRLGLSAFWILFSILFFGAIWGVGGMLVGAPLFAVLYDLARDFILENLHKKNERDILKTYEERKKAE